MTLRQLVHKAGGINSPQMDYEFVVYDIDLSIDLDIDPQLIIDNDSQKITLKVEG